MEDILKKEQAVDLKLYQLERALQKLESEDVGCSSTAYEHHVQKLNALRREILAYKIKMGYDTNEFMEAFYG